MQSKLYKPYSILSVALFIIGILFSSLAIVSLIFISVMIGKIILAASLFGFSFTLITAGVYEVLKRKEKLKFFLKDMDLSDKVERKFLILFDGPEELKEKVLKEMDEIELILRSEDMLKEIEDTLQLVCNVNKDCYSPITFIKVKEEGNVFCQGDKVYGYQQGNYIEISFLQENTFLLFLHEVIHLILERSGKTGDHHPIICDVMETIHA